MKATQKVKGATTSVTMEEVQNQDTVTVLFPTWEIAVAIVSVIIIIVNNKILKVFYGYPILPT